MLSGFLLLVHPKWVGILFFGWALLCGLLAYLGFANNFAALPPRLFLFFVPTILLVVWIVFYGAKDCVVSFPYAVLVGFQSFRILVELLIHQAVVEGVAPEQLTWTGLNYDIVTGVVALILAPFAKNAPRWILHLFNFVGFWLLAQVVIVAIISMPTAFQILEPANVWVAHFPFIWLPLVLVSFALMGHLALFRKLVHEKRTLSEAVPKMA